MRPRLRMRKEVFLRRQAEACFGKEGVVVCAGKC